MTNIYIKHKFGRNREVLLLEAWNDVEHRPYYSLLVRQYNGMYWGYYRQLLWTPSFATASIHALVWLEVLTCTVDL